MVNNKNMLTSATSVRRGLCASPLGNCQRNSKIYHSFTYLLYTRAHFSTVGASVFAWGVFDRVFLRIAWGFCLGVSADFCGFLHARDIPQRNRNLCKRKPRAESKNK